MWFIGVEVEQETSAPPPKKILDPPLLWFQKSKNLGPTLYYSKLFYNVFLFPFNSFKIKMHSISIQY